MWGYFWLILGAMVFGAFLFAVGVMYGMFMSAVASNDVEDEEENDWSGYRP